MRIWGQQQKFLLVLATLASTIAFPALSRAGEDARVLPIGRSRLSLIYGQSASISSTFNYEGGQRSITAPYNIELSSQNLKQFSPVIGDLVDSLNTNGSRYHYNVNERNNGYNGVTTNPNDPLLGDAISRGFLNVGAEGSRQQYNFVLQYGISDRLSLGFGIPLIKNQVKVSSSFNGVNTANDIYRALKGIDPQIDSALDQLRTINEDTLQKLLAEKGYDRFADTSGTGLGDSILGARFKYHDAHHVSGDWIASVQTGFTVPTGAVKTPRQITSLDYGQGAWDASFAHIVNFTPTQLLTFSQGMHYTAPFWGTKAMRIRKNSTDLIPDASTEENVNFRLGEKAAATVGSRLNISKAVILDVNYEWAWKGSSTFRGKRPDADYSYMSVPNPAFYNPEAPSYLETVSMAFSVSSIPAFLKYEFPLPADINVSLNLPVTGRNIIIAPYGTAELALYF